MRRLCTRCSAPSLLPPQTEAQTSPSHPSFYRDVTSSCPPPLFDNFPQDRFSIKKKNTMSYNAGCADSSAVRITPFLVMLTISFPVQSVQHPPYCCASDAKSPLRPPRDFRTLGRLSHSPRLSPRGRRRRREFSEVPAKIRPVAPRRRQLRQDDATHELLSPSPPPSRQRPPFPRSFSRACDLRHFRRSSLSPCLTPTLHHREPPLRITGASETHSRERPGDELFKLARKSDRRVTWRRRVAYRVTCLWGALGD